MLFTGDNITGNPAWIHSNILLDTVYSKFIEIGFVNTTLTSLSVNYLLF